MQDSSNFVFHTLSLSKHSVSFHLSSTSVRGALVLKELLQPQLTQTALEHAAGLQ